MRAGLAVQVFKRECSGLDIKFQGNLSHPRILRCSPRGNLVSYRIFLQVGEGGQEQKKHFPKITVPQQIPSALGFNLLGLLETPAWDPVGQESQSFPFPEALHHLGFGFPTLSTPKLPTAGKQAGGAGAGALTPIPKEAAALSLLGVRSVGGPGWESGGVHDPKPLGLEVWGITAGITPPCKFGVWKGWIWEAPLGWDSNLS